MLPLLATALAAAGLILFAPGAGVASPNCDEPDPAPLCDGEQPAGGDPFGALEATSYSWGWNTGSAQHTMVVSGWAIDPDTSGPIEVRLEVAAFGGSSASVTATASRYWPGLHAAYGQGDDHGFEIAFTMPRWENALYGEFCVTALDVGHGVDAVLGCDYWVND